MEVDIQYDVMIYIEDNYIVRCYVVEGFIDKV